MDILIIARKAEALAGFLDREKHSVRTATDGYTVRAVDLSLFDVIFISLPLENESGVELVSEMRERTKAHIIAIVKEERADSMRERISSLGAYIITRPLFKGALMQAASFCELNLAHEKELRAKAEELSRRLEEQKTLFRAKLILVQRGMTEEEAHRHIQQTAMDNRLTQNEVAERIISEK